MFMIKGKRYMKYLRVDNRKGQFLKDDNWVDITSLGKDDLLRMVRAALEDDQFEIDEYDEDALPNPAHKIIYKHVCQQLTDIHARRNEYQEARRNLFKDAYEQYCMDI